MVPSEPESKRIRVPKVDQKVLDVPMGIVVAAHEWQALEACQESCTMLRSFSCAHHTLTAVVRTKDGYSVVGVIHLQSVSEVPSLKKLERDGATIHSRQEFRQLATVKCLRAYLVNSVEKCEEPIPLPWLNNVYRNRVFKMNWQTDILAVGAQIPGPVSMSLEQTAEFYFKRWPRKYQDIMCTLMESLNGKALKVGTTCSGSDIVIAALTQSVAFLNTLKVRGWILQ